MFVSRVRRGLMLSALAAVGSGHAALFAGEPKAPPARRPTVQPTSTRTTPITVEMISQEHKDAVAEVIKQPTISAKAREDEFAAHAEVYDWLLQHPDRVSLAWQRRKVPCIAITDQGNGQFSWKDDNGSQLSWQLVGKFSDGMIWYATGKVKPGTLMPVVPIKAVALLHAPRTKLSDGTALLKPAVSVYLLTDSRAANTVLRVVGPAGPRMAEQGAEQLLLFFSALATHLYHNPDQIPELLAPAPAHGK